MLLVGHDDRLHRAQEGTIRRTSHVPWTIAETMTRHARDSHDAIPGEALDELQRLYAKADALVLDATCACTDGHDVEAALCCHFAKIGREPPKRAT